MAQLAQFLIYGEKATIIPVHKKGKDKKDPNSYRPISLLICLGKLLERVINRRLIFLEERKYCHRRRLDIGNTEAQKISWPSLPKRQRMPFKKRKRLSVFFDLTKNSDKVWREGLLLNILEIGGPGRMYRWIRCFLHDRSARIKLG